MNGYFIWNLFMTLICAFNYCTVQRNPFAPAWGKALLFFLMLMMMALTAMSYGE